LRLQPRILIAAAERQGRARERGNVLDQLLSNASREVFGIGNAKALVDRDNQVDRKLMTDPTCFHISDGAHPGDVPGGMTRFIDDIRVDAIEHARDNRSR
jgi:hypothetical protein